VFRLIGIRFFESLKVIKLYPLIDFQTKCCIKATVKRAPNLLMFLQCGFDFSCYSLKLLYFCLSLLCE